jgi:Fe2+ transport system protein B
MKVGSQKSHRQAFSTTHGAFFNNIVSRWMARPWQKGRRVVSYIRSKPLNTMAYGCSVPSIAATSTLATIRKLAERLLTFINFTKEWSNCL